MLSKRKEKDRWPMFFLLSKPMWCLFNVHLMSKCIRTSLKEKEGGGGGGEGVK